MKMSPAVKPYGNPADLSKTIPNYTPKYYARDIARLVKLLDNTDAECLVQWYLVFPEDIVEDLPYIKAAADAGKTEYISELMHWYRCKDLGEKPLENGLGLRPKTNLPIFKIAKTK